MRGAREADLRVRSLGLAPRFVLSMTAALTLVMGTAAVVLYVGITNILAEMRDDTLSGALILNTKKLGGDVAEELQPVEQIGATATSHRSGVRIFEVRYGQPPREGTLYLQRFLDQNEDIREARLLVPAGRRVGGDLLGMIVGILLVVVLVGAGVALWVAGQVTRPIHRVIEDIRQIAKGDLHHKTRAVGSGEVELLARSVDRMTRDLGNAQDAKLELSVREREMDVAGEVQDALIPLTTPLVDGYDIGALYVSAAVLSGDFHDFIELEDGRVGLLVCDVSGSGVPAALVAATARSYCRSELHRGGDVGEAMRRINRWLVEDVRRGMFVTALYVLIDPRAGQASVACAGHKVPLMRFSAEDGNLRVVHPEGIALGFDRGPVFDRRLEVLQVPVEVGDRLLLANSAPLTITNEEGRELGEKAFFARVLKHARLETTACLKSLRRDLEQYAGGGELPVDVSLVTIARLR